MYGSIGSQLVATAEDFGHGFIWPFRGFRGLERNSGGVLWFIQMPLTVRFPKRSNLGAKLIHYKSGGLRLPFKDVKRIQQE